MWDDKSKDFQAPPPAVLFYWIPECPAACFSLNAFSPWPKGVSSCSGLSTQWALFVLLCCLSSQQNELGTSLAKKWQQFALNAALLPSALYALSFQRMWVCFLQSICSNLWWHQTPCGGSKRDPTAGLWLLPSNSIHRRAGGMLFLPSLEEQVLIFFTCDSRNWIIGADLTRNARIAKSREFSH